MPILPVGASAVLGSIFAGPVLADDVAESKLDAALKLLYRAQEAADPTPSRDAVAAPSVKRRGSGAAVVSENAKSVLKAPPDPSGDRGPLPGRPVSGRLGSRPGANVPSPAPARPGIATLPAVPDVSDPQLSLLLRHLGDASALATAGFRVQTKAGQIYTGTLPISRLRDLTRLSDVVSAQSSHELRASHRCHEVC